MHGRWVELRKVILVTYPSSSVYSGKFPVKIEFVGNYSGSKTLYYEIVIGAVDPKFDSSSTKSIKLTWTKANSDLSYRVYAVDKDGKQKKLGDTKNNYFTVSSLSSGKNYRFAVKAYVKDRNGKAYWGKSGKTVSCVTKPSKVTGVSASRGTNSIKLTWKKVGGADCYGVYMYNAKTKKFELIKTVSGTSCKVTKLASGTTYRFKIRAVKKAEKAVYGAYSSEFRFATKPETPKLKAAAGSKKVSLSWTNVRGESGYEVYYAAKKDGKYKKLAAVKADTVKLGKSFKSGTYYFKVRAYKTEGNAKIYGAFSNTVKVKLK